jgi:hypothetical protein
MAYLSAWDGLWTTTAATAFAKNQHTHGHFYGSGRPLRLLAYTHGAFLLEHQS